MIDLINSFIAARANITDVQVHIGLLTDKEAEGLAKNHNRFCYSSFRDDKYFFCKHKYWSILDPDNWIHGPGYKVIV